MGVGPWKLGSWKLGGRGSWNVGVGFVWFPGQALRTACQEGAGILMRRVRTDAVLKLACSACAAQRKCRSVFHIDAALCRSLHPHPMQATAFSLPPPAAALATPCRAANIFAAEPTLSTHSILSSQIGF